MSTVMFWILVGFVGQMLFTARFVVQWLVSERQGDSVMPVIFWWLSLIGGAVMLSYAISRRDPVCVTGQAVGLLVYSRNLMLVGKSPKQSTRSIPPERHQPG